MRTGIQRSALFFVINRIQRLIAQGLNNIIHKSSISTFSKIRKTARPESDRAEQHHRLFLQSSSQSMKTSLTHWIAQKHFKSTVTQVPVASKFSTSQTASRSNLPPLNRSTLLPLKSRGSSTWSVAQQLSKIFCTLKKIEKHVAFSLRPLVRRPVRIHSLRTFFFFFEHCFEWITFFVQ